MPGKKKIESYLQKRFGDMRESLEKFYAAGDQEELHKFRVSAKKVRMVIRLLDYIGGNKKIKKAYKPLKQVFKEAGEVRSSYIILRLLGKYDMKNTPIARNKKKELETLSHHFIAQKESYSDLVDEAEHVITQHADKIGRKALEAYIQLGLHKVAMCLQAAPGSEKLHEMRGIIKTIEYSVSLLKHNQDHFPGPNIAYLDRMQSCMGQWHDADSVIQVTADSRLSARVKGQVSKESARLYQKTLSLAHNFMDKAFTPAHKLSVK